MRDKKFAIAIGVIIVLLLIMAIVFGGIPLVKKYNQSNFIKGAQTAVETIALTVEQQGYVQLNYGTNSTIILIKYQEVQNG